MGAGNVSAAPQSAAERNRELYQKDVDIALDAAQTLEERQKAAASAVRRGERQLGMTWGRMAIEAIQSGLAGGELLVLAAEGSPDPSKVDWRPVFAELLANPAAGVAVFEAMQASRTLWPADDWSGVIVRIGSDNIPRAIWLEQEALAKAIHVELARRARAQCEESVRKQNELYRKQRQGIRMGVTDRPRPQAYDHLGSVGRVHEIDLSNGCKFGLQLTYYGDGRITEKGAQVFKAWKRDNPGKSPTGWMKLYAPPRPRSGFYEITITAMKDAPIHEVHWEWGLDPKSKTERLEGVDVDRSGKRTSFTLELSSWRPRFYVSPDWLYLSRALIHFSDGKIVELKLKTPLESQPVNGQWEDPGEWVKLDTHHFRRLRSDAVWEAKPITDLLNLGRECSGVDMTVTTLEEIRLWTIAKRRSEGERLGVVPR
jgi:hypothetical protein